ncbi:MULTISPECIES: glycosyltransferase family 39 protein [unclassified Mesorhizobium]|uniref:glycosyltransferase family 39 protein n=1 Tax=unclassified Mesorhizobium TaxID=325217 RepID=UPI000FDA94B6|nr:MULTISPECIES: glycosyltransferase family 39 protein [unclassified Mesorhizobium]TGQ04848.1 glycosyltransferase [Mesorhizobium sp. M2E.F.Ca.ET.219.01.1.1]TGT65442.1 glycosyltransferase [Mesorhizobium sp. M2E.F.Ca.ET.166.01.1.1]TGV97488.1 glycosyltransferase [Mesorhizobium sp. M2E.F.Ca.ET.154.01.1.1]
MHSRVGSNLAEASSKSRPGDATVGAVHPSVSIIVPTLNEVGNVDRTLRAILAQVSRHCEFEIIVTDGGSADGTCAKVTDWQESHPVRLLRNGSGRGLAADVLWAASNARFSILVVLDADGSHPATSIMDLVRPIAAGHFDMVIGSRYCEGGASVGWPLHRRILSRIGASFAAPFTDVEDPLSGFFAIRRECLLRGADQAEGFKIGLEALHAGGGDLRVAEKPITFCDRHAGKSKIGARQFIAYLAQLVRFSRGTTSSDAVQRFLAVGMVGFLLDLCAVSILLAAGAGLAVAHICGFCFAAAFNYIGHARWSFEGRASGRAGSTRFLVISILALAIRGGLIAAGSGALGLPLYWALLGGIVGGGVVSYLGNEFYVFRPNASLSAPARWNMAALAITAYVVVLRLVYQGDMDLIPQEAYYWNYAQHPAWGYLDHPPMVAWLIRLGSAIFGDSEFGVRIMATGCWLVTAFFSFRLAHNLFGRRDEAFIALMLLSVLPFFMGVGLLATPDAPLTAAWAGALYFLERATIGLRPTAWLGAGLCVGLGMLSKYTIALLGPATLVFLLIHPQTRLWFSTRWPYLAAILALAVFSPVIAWNGLNGWASFEFQGSRRWSGEEMQFSVHSLIGYIAVLLGPIGIWLGIAAASKLVWRPDRFHARAATTFVLIFTLVPLSVFAAFSILHAVKMNWTGPIWLALLPAMANVVATAVRSGSMPRMIIFLKMGTVASVLVFAVLLHYVALGLPFVGYSGSLRGLPVAWEEFSLRAEQIGAAVKADTGYSPLLVGMDKYNIASELAFYGRGRTGLENITSQNVFGEEGLMFGVWNAPSLSRRGAVILFGVKEDSVSSNRLARWFEHIGSVRTETVWKNHAVVGRFFYRVGYNYRRPTDVAPQ